MSWDPVVALPRLPLHGRLSSLRLPPATLLFRCKPGDLGSPLPGGRGRAGKGQPVLMRGGWMLKAT